MYTFLHLIKAKKTNRKIIYLKLRSFLLVVAVRGGVIRGGEGIYLLGHFRSAVIDLHKSDATKRERKTEREGVT